MLQISNNKKEETARRLLRFVPLFLALLLWCVLIFKEQFYLKKIENLSVFLFDKQFVVECFRTPGGFLGLVGEFFTQFLHLPWLGALIWVGMLLLAYYLTVRVLRIPQSFSVLALIPVALLVLGNMSLGYEVFIMREQDHFFAPVLGYMVSIIPLAVTRQIKSPWNKLLFITGWIVLGFALFGAFAFTGALIAGSNELITSGYPRKNKITLFVLTLSLIVLIPLIIYSAYTTYRLAESWIQGLPAISEDVLTRSMRAPFQLALLFQIILALISGWLSGKDLKPSKEALIQTSICLITVITVWGFWFKDDNFHTELAMSDAVDRFDWNRTIDIFNKAAQSHAKSDERAYASRTKKIAAAHSNEEITDIVERYQERFFEPTRTMVMYRDLALLKTNRALDESFTMKNGGRLQNTPLQVPMAWQSGKQFYLQYGLVNMSYRWCLEDAVEHNWSYGTLKYMAMHAIIMQEGELAEKYINKLEKTIFYRKWSRAQRALESDRKAMEASVPYKDIIPYMCFENRMTNDVVKSEMFIISHFVNNPEPPAATPEYDRAALLFAMQTQDIPRFWERLYYYINSNDLKTLPRSVQEAAILYSSLEKDDRQIPFDNKIVEGFEAFNKYVQSHPIRSMKESEYPYGQKFGKTFYYFYYFIRNLQTY